MRFVSCLLNARAPSLTSSRNGTMTSRAPTPSRFSKSTTSYSETVEVKRPWKLLKRSSLQPLTLRLYKHRQLPTIATAKQFPTSLNTPMHFQRNHVRRVTLATVREVACPRRYRVHLQVMTSIRNRSELSH